MYVGEFFILGSQESPSALELFEDLCEKHFRKKHRYKCCETEMYRVYSWDLKAMWLGQVRKDKSGEGDIQQDRIM